MHNSLPVALDRHSRPDYESVRISRRTQKVRLVEPEEESRPAESTTSEQPPEPPPPSTTTQDPGGPEDRADRGPLLITVLVCLGAAVAGHAFLWLNHRFGWGNPWQPVIGISVSVVAIAAFGGFYVASRRARIAIASSFLLTFLVILTFVMTIEAFSSAAKQGIAADLFNDFRNVITVIIGFYFGTEAAVSVAKVIGVARQPADTAEIQRADRDLVSPSPP